MPDLVLFSDISEIEKSMDFLGAGKNELVIAGNFSENQLNELREKAKKTKLEISFCKILERPDHRELQQFRNKPDYIAVDGRDLQLNKFACSTKGIDFLLQPFDSGKLYFDVSMARLAAANNVAIAFLFSDFLNAGGSEFALLLKNAATIKKIVKRGRAKQVIFSGALNKWELRATNDLEEFLGALK